MPVRKTRRRKVKRKTRKQKGGDNTNTTPKPLAEMPQLCFGTVQSGLPYTLPAALELGYRHIDGAEAYDHMHRMYGLPNYKEIINKVLADMRPRIKRHELWITWKDDHPTIEKIKRTLSDLGCEYFDLFLFHHSCGTPGEFAILQEAQKMGLIRHFGVSNCEQIETLVELKKKYNIYANQIQARPPGGSITSRPMMEPEFIPKCNALGIRVMLFSTISSIMMLLSDGLLSKSNTDFFYTNSEKINKYYIQKFLKPSNVLMVASQTGSSLEPNLKDVTHFLSGNTLLSKEDMKSIEEYLLSLNLAYT